MAKDEVNFSALQSDNELEALFQRSYQAPTALFLHDRWCPISGHAYKEMSQLDPTARAKVALVDVTAGQELSHLIEERTGVRHESPQVLVVRDGQVTWHGSHFAITAKAVGPALAPQQ